MSLELRDLDNNLVDAENNPLISTHEGLNGSPDEVVFKVVNNNEIEKTARISLISFSLPDRSEYRIAVSGTQLSGEEWSEIEENVSKDVVLEAGEEAIVRVRIFIPGGTDTQIIDADITIEEVN